MKTTKHTTIDGKTIELQIPETPEEEAEIQRKMQKGEVDDGHAFSDDERERVED